MTYRPLIFFLLSFGCEASLSALAQRDQTATGDDTLWRNPSEEPLTPPEQLREKCTDVSIDELKAFLQQGANPNKLHPLNCDFWFCDGYTLYRPEDQDVWYEGFHQGYRLSDKTTFCEVVLKAQKTNNLEPVRFLLNHGALPQVSFSEKDGADEDSVRHIQETLKVLGKKEETLSALPGVYDNVELARLLIKAGADPYKIGLLKGIVYTMLSTTEGNILWECNMLHVSSGMYYSPEILELYLKPSLAQIDVPGSSYYALYSDHPEVVSRTPLTDEDEVPEYGTFSVLLENQTPLSCLLYSVASNWVKDKDVADIISKFKMLVEYGADPTIKQRMTTFPPQNECIRTIKHIYNTSEISPLEFVKQQLNKYEKDNQNDRKVDNTWSRRVHYYKHIEFYNTYKEIYSILKPLTAQYESAKALAEAAQTSRSPRDINAALKELRALRGEKFHPSSWVVRTIKELETMACVAYKLQKIEALDGR